MWINLELNKKNYGAIRSSIGLLSLHKHHFNTSVYSFWNDSTLVSINPRLQLNFHFLVSAR